MPLSIFTIGRFEYNFREVWNLAHLVAARNSDGVLCMSKSVLVMVDSSCFDVLAWSDVRRAVAEKRPIPRLRLG